MKNKRFSRLLALLLGLLMLSTMCVTAVAEEKVTLTVSAQQNWIKDIDRELAARFTELYGIEIDFQVNPDDQYTNIIKTKLATNEGPDIFYFTAGIALENFQPEKNLVDLSEEPWVEKMKSWAITSCTINGKLYGLNTWSVDGNGILYNKQIFDEYGLEPPTNFEELKEICAVLLENGIRPIYENAKDLWHLPQWIAHLGAELDAEIPGFVEKANNNEAFFADSQVLTQALMDYKELYDLGYLGDTALSDEWIPGYEAMGTGKAAMINTYTTYPSEVLEQFPDSQADTWGMFPVMIGGCTSFSQGAGGIARGINANSEHIEEAKLYLQFLTEDQNIIDYYTVRTDLSETSVEGIEVREMSNAYNTFKEYSVNGVGVGLPSCVKYFSNEVVAKAMQNMLVGTMEPNEVLQELDADRAKSFAAIGK